MGQLPSCAVGWAIDDFTPEAVGGAPALREAVRSGFV
jgi:hypothetical protein